MSRSSFSHFRLSRRTLVGSGVASAAFLPLRSRPEVAAHQAGGTFPTAARYQEAASSPEGWHTWYLTSPDELRPAAPGTPTQEEIDELVQLEADRTDEMTAIVARWGTGPALFPWSALAGELFTEFMVGGMQQNRLTAIYHTALHDAVIAAWDAQVAFARPSPGATSDALTPLAGVDPTQPSFPSVHAAIAGAAAVVLPALLPDAAPGRFDTLATEAAESRLVAGAAFRSDIEAGLALGRAVGERAVERARNDGSDAKWDPAEMPTGPGIWQPTPPGFVETPLNPLAGSWKTWIMTSGDQFRPAPPPEYGSPAWEAEVMAVQDIAANLTFEQQRAAVWWATNSPAVLVTKWIHELIGKEGVDLPHAARILAYALVAAADSSIAVWDAKYTWWTTRPITEIPTLKTLVPTPPYPAYPSGYSAILGSTTTVAGFFFPEVVDDFASRAVEAAASRAWAGIHYVIDDDIGLAMGRQVGRLVYAAARADGTESAA
jgi:membrane-associated phospholipid phosphatase